MNKTIYLYWAQGADALPDLAKRANKFWQRLNPDFELIVLDQEKARPYLPKFTFDFSALPFQSQADIVRVVMLAQTGGVWVDTAVVPLQPLENWLPKRMDSGFFLFHDPRRGRIIENWFIAADKGNRLIEAWRDAILDYWAKPRRKQIWSRELNAGWKGDVQRQIRHFLKNSAPIKRREKVGKQIFEPKNRAWAVSRDGGGASDVHPYFWPHYVFEEMLTRDAKAEEAWHNVPRYSSYDNLMLRHSKKRYPTMTIAEMKSLVAGSQMQKLHLNKPLPTAIEMALFDHVIAQNNL